MTKTVMIVDDEERIVSVVKAYLEKDGYRVVTASDGREAIFVARQEKPNLIVLDIMMPQMDGYDFIRLHRKERETPIILLTAKIEEDNRILGLELGADDYVTKPFSPRELVARVRAVLRRAEKDAAEPDFLRVGEIVLDRSSYLVKVGGQPVDLTRSEFDLLAVLMSQPGRAFTRQDLLDRLQPDGGIPEGYERTIDVHIKNLRGKIEPNPKEPRYIETVYGVGYRLSLDE